MAGELTAYHVLHESLASRRRRPEAPRGLDALAARLGAKARQSRVTLGFLARWADRIESSAAGVRALSEPALDARLAEMRGVFVRRRQDDRAVAEALALVREVARRSTGEEAYPVQLMGALALYHGRIVEMLTGEGKTLTGSLAAPLIAWSRRRLHVLTVNDYLAERDAASRAPILGRCGLQCAAVTHETPPGRRAAVYAMPVVFGTPKQITADWLRDRVRLSGARSAWAARSAGTGGALVPGLSAALVDEADAVLVDEAGTPLIIARARGEDKDGALYAQARGIAQGLEIGRDYTVDELRRKAELTRAGRERVARARAGLAHPVWRAPRRGEELVRQALVASRCYHAGRHYQVVDGRVVIVDEYTGRVLPDRSWEHGLHQSIEAKEGLTVTADRETLARVSFQRFFRSYGFLCGMTGTAADATPEFESVYGRTVVRLPTHRPVRRLDLPPRFFATAGARWSAVVAEVESVSAQGRPVLVGTRSVAASEHLSGLLAERGLAHRVLNALHDADEAGLIAQAGRPGAITVATNMAGRGTDILLDPASREAGGLHVILTELHAARRIDRQFIGRAGRQGDPGSSRVFASLEDELVRLHARGLAAALGSAAGATSGELPARAPARALFRLAQRRAEARARMQRGQVLRHDDWMDKHLPGS